jgi:hypothetical protein
MPSPDEQFMQLSLEEGEGDGMVGGISESLVQDVKKSAIELLAVRSKLINRLCSSEYPAVLEESH